MTDEYQPLWPDERISKIQVRYADKVHFMQMIRDDERKPLLARIAELKSAYKGLTELNQRNCDDALRIKGSSDAAFALAFLAFDDIKAKDARIAELQNQLHAALEEIERGRARYEAAIEGQWEPLRDGEYIMPSWGERTYTLHVCGDGAELEAWSNAAEDKHKDGTPMLVQELGVGDYRLCRLQPASAGSEGSEGPVQDAT